MEHQVYPPERESQPFPIPNVPNQESEPPVGEPGRHLGLAVFPAGQDTELSEVRLEQQPGGGGLAEGSRSSGNEDSLAVHGVNA